MVLAHESNPSSAKRSKKGYDRDDYGFCHPASALRKELCPFCLVAIIHCEHRHGRLQKQISLTAIWKKTSPRFVSEGINCKWLSKELYDNEPSESDPDEKSDHFGQKLKSEIATRLQTNH